MADKGLFYKNRPLVRRGSKVFYGGTDDIYYIEMNILEKTTIVDIDVSTKISVQLVRQLEGSDREIVKKAECGGIYSAVNLSSDWLEEALTGE